MSQQATLGTFEVPRDLEDAHDTREIDARHWDPLAGRDPTKCLNCGAAVDKNLRRLYGIGSDNHVDGCHSCLAGREMMGGATVPGREPRQVGPE